MGKRIAIFAGLVLSIGSTVAASAQQAEPGIPEQLKVTIDAQQTAAPISKYLYGGFIEHGGTLMYRSLWSELLDDRKFYFPITSKTPQNRLRHEVGRSGCLPVNGGLLVRTMLL